MKILPFEPDHLHELADLGGQTVNLEPSHAVDLHNGGPAFSGFVGGEIIGCAGIVMIHDYRAIAWAGVRTSFRKNFVSVHKAVQRFLSDCKVVRIEAHVQIDYEPGHRWALALGFRPEGPAMPYFLPGGLTAQQYVRLKEGEHGDWSGHRASQRRRRRNRGDPAG